MTTTIIAFDRQSARSFDADGRMRVKDCVLSTAEVNPYRGREIPRAADLGLESNTVYDLFRDPQELGHPETVQSFEGIPLMVKHVVQTADEPRKDYVGGSVHNVRFDGKKLRGDLLVWDGSAIDLIESDELSDLSCGYRYIPVMQSGEAGGNRFDGRMTAIRGNHVALVDNGRATGAHVADAALTPQSSTPKGAFDMAFPEANDKPEAGGAEPKPAAPAPAPAAPAPQAGGDMAAVGAAIKALSEQMAQLMQMVGTQQQAAPAAAAAPAAGLDMDIESEPNANKGKANLNTGAAADEGEEGNQREGENAREAHDEDDEDDEGEDRGGRARDEDISGGEGGKPTEGRTNQIEPDPHSEGRSHGESEPPPAGSNAPPSGAMDAAIDRAVKRERERGKAVAQAKRDVAGVLGGDIALDDAGTIYREALELLGVDTSRVKKGTEQYAWQAARAGHAAAHGARVGASSEMAMDSDATKKQAADFVTKLNRIRVQS